MMAGTKADVAMEMRCSGSGDTGSFSEERLVDELNKLNNSAVSIKTLSKWCILHRKRARRVVDTWEKQFSSATEDKKISFLFLSNEIVQNCSKLKGGDYVHEFLRVLPRSLKYVYENGGEEGKKLVARLIGIWDERKVFGTHIESLKDNIFGDNPHVFANNGNKNNSSPISNPLNSKVARKGSDRVLKVVTAYQSVLDQEFNEDTALNKCKSTVSVMGKIKKDIDDASTKGDQLTSTMISDLKEHESILKESIAQLESVGVARISLINQLKEALIDQESKSEVLRSQLQVARAEVEHAIQLRQRLGYCAVVTNGTESSSSLLMINPTKQASAMIHGSRVRLMSPQLQSISPATSLAPTVSAVGDEHKKMAAAMADKLASLSAPVQVLTSVLSDFVAEHGASLSSMNGGLPYGELSRGLPGFQIEKRLRLEKTTQGSDMGGRPSFSMQLPHMHQQTGSVPSEPPLQINQALLGPFAPPPPPLPSSLPPHLQQFGQSTGGMMGMRPFGIMADYMPPMPPMSNIMPAGFPGPSGAPPPPLLPLAQNQPQWWLPQAPQQSPTPAGFFQSSPDMGYFPPV